MIRTTVYLPLNYVENQIQVASAAMKGNHPDTAKAQAAIDKALGSLIKRQIAVADFPQK
jgi:benzoyl-CoA reductase/2-hydroxyglutaryl-CoA dehydratase subunit BcrC/BadD/HgdB